MKNKNTSLITIQERKERLRHVDFVGQQVAIIAPTLDETCQFIKRYNPQRHWQQSCEASMLLHHVASMQSKGNKGRVCILADGDEANETDQRFDYVIFLHNFLAIERNYILEGLREHNEQLQIIDLT